MLIELLCLWLLFLLQPNMAGVVRFWASFRYCFCSFYYIELLIILDLLESDQVHWNLNQSKFVESLIACVSVPMYDYIDLLINLM